MSWGFGVLGRDRLGLRVCGMGFRSWRVVLGHVGWADLALIWGLGGVLWDWV